MRKVYGGPLPMLMLLFLALTASSLLAKRFPVQQINNSGYKALIAAEAGIQQFVQSSVPTHLIESTVPELANELLSSGSRHLQ